MHGSGDAGLRCEIAWMNTRTMNELWLVVKQAVPACVYAGESRISRLRHESLKCTDCVCRWMNAHFSSVYVGVIEADGKSNWMCFRDVYCSTMLS